MLNMLTQDKPAARSDHPAAFTVLIDGLCPLCRTEGEFLHLLDAGRGRLHLVDITAPDFNPADYGRTSDQLLGEIHGVMPDGRIVIGMEVFRQAYQALGLGWLLAPTGWPGIRPFADYAYKLFAKNRLRITGQADRCESGRCRT